MKIEEKIEKYLVSESTKDLYDHMKGVIIKNRNRLKYKGWEGYVGRPPWSMSQSPSVVRWENDKYEDYYLAITPYIYKKAGIFVEEGDEYKTKDSLIHFSVTGDEKADFNLYMKEVKKIIDKIKGIQ